MPLRDHFRPPLSVTHPWKSFHSAWANAITNQLNVVLPEGYYAIPEVPLGDQTEIDAATPPRPHLAALVDFSGVHGVAVHVFEDMGGPRIRAAIELVSPADKDRLRSRITFADKCVGYLKHGVSLVVIDTVTNRQANMHAEIAQALEATTNLAWAPSSHLYAAAYRTVVESEKTQVQIWTEALSVGAELPILPLWLTRELVVPLPLESSYLAACHSLRIDR
jgi:hypothetical protein